MVDDPMSSIRTFPNAPQAVAGARRFTLDQLYGIPPDIADELAVMVSELATNSVRHTRTPFTIEIDQRAQEIYVGVTDSGSGEPVVQHPAPTQPSGRGLQIVGALARAWGVRSTGHAGKTVWFTVAYSLPH
jgi:anti-sigma regulatory factor (Ser/Thr protein kinase)